MDNWDRMQDLEKKASDILKWTSVQIASCSDVELERALEEHFASLGQKNENDDKPTKLIQKPDIFPRLSTSNAFTISRNDALLDALICFYELVSIKPVDSDTLFLNKKKIK